MHAMCKICINMPVPFIGSYRDAAACYERAIQLENEVSHHEVRHISRLHYLTSDYHLNHKTLCTLFNAVLFVHCCSAIFRCIRIRESVDSLCRDGTNMPIT